MITSIDITGDWMTDLHVLINAYKANGVGTVVVETPTGGTKITPEPVRKNEDSPVKRMAEEIRQRFPKNLTPNSKQLNEIWSKVNNWDDFLDLLLVAEEAAQTQKINSIGGFLLYQLQQDDSNLTTITANAERIRENQRNDTPSIIANVMQQAEKKIQKLPARSGPDTAGANRLKSLKIGGAANLERAEGSEETTES